MLTDTVALDNVRVEIGRLRIWYEVYNGNGKMAEELKAIPNSKLFKDYQEQWYSEQGFHYYFTITLRSKGKALMKEGDLPYDPLLYWASRSSDLDGMVAAYQRIDSSFCPHFHLIPLTDPTCEPMREQFFMNRFFEDKRYIEGKVYWCLLGTATVNLREAVNYFRQNLYELPKVQRYDASPLPGVTYCQFVEWAQGKGLSRLKQGGSNPETDKIKATKAACSLVFGHHIRGQFKPGTLARDHFRKLVKKALEAQGESSLYQQTAADTWYATKECVKAYKRTKGRPRKEK